MREINTPWITTLFFNSKEKHEVLPLGVISELNYRR
jgi:hypothetical protein